MIKRYFSFSVFSKKYARKLFSEQFNFYNPKSLLSKTFFNLESSTCIDFKVLNSSAVKPIIFLLFASEQGSGTSNFSFLLSKYKVNKERRISLSIRFPLPEDYIQQTLLPVILPKYSSTESDPIFFSLNSKTSPISFLLNSVVNISPYINTDKKKLLFHFFFLKTFVFYYRLSFSSLKHNFLLRNCISYFGLLIL